MPQKEAKSLKGFDILFNKNVPHIWEKIFLNLDCDSFMECRKVSKLWRGLLSTDVYKKQVAAYYEKLARIKMEQRLLEFSRCGNTKGVRSLLEIGVDPNCYDAIASPTGSTPLIAAACNGRRYVVAILLGDGANPDKTGWYDRTALHWAAERGERGVVHLLVNAGADINLEDRFGDTPVYLATSNGHEEVARLLIAAGANDELYWNLGVEIDIYAPYTNPTYPISPMYFNICLGILIGMILLMILSHAFLVSNRYVFPSRLECSLVSFSTWECSY